MSAVAMTDATPAPKSARAWSPRRTYIALAVAPVAFFALFFLFPVGRLVLLSVTEPEFGFANYVHILTRGPYLAVLFRTLLIALGVTLVCLALAYPLAYFMSRLKGAAFKIAIGLVLIPLWTSVVIRSFAWMIIFQRTGIMNDALVWLGLIEMPVKLLQTPLAVTVGMVHVMLPYMVLPILASMRSVDPVLIRAASVLGARPLRLFVRVYLPLTLPGVSAGAVLVFVLSLGFYITPALLGGTGSTMIAVLINQQASQMLNWPMAAALSTVLLVVTLAIIALHLRLMRRFNEARG